MALNAIQVTDPRIELAGGLHVGEPLSKFLTILQPTDVGWKPADHLTRFTASYLERKDGVTFEGNATLELKSNDTGAVRSVAISYWAD